MATSIRMPLALATVSLANANAFWTTKDGTNFDYSYVAFKDAVTGTALYWGIVPKNLAATANWTVYIHHAVDSGAGGNVILDVSGLDFADTATIDAALTSLESDRTLATGASGTINLDNLATTGAAIFDADEAIAAGNYLLIQINRDGNNASDTLSQQWNLLGVYLECDVQ